MYISKKNREIIKNKYGGKCAYSGTDLLPDWQVDHIKPLIRHPFSGEPMFGDAHHIDNMVPCQRIINHYKGSLDLQTFRIWFLGGLHIRLKKLPRNPKAEKSIRGKAYLLEVASLFGITETTPFSGIFYFETHAD
jgi:5-methylcytosine-specific restriction endonuclease McrA